MAQRPRVPFQPLSAGTIGLGLLLAIPIIIGAHIFGWIANDIAKSLGLW